MKIEIKRYSDNSVLFSHDVEGNTLKTSLLAVVKAGADLRNADLCGVDLSGADLDGENISQGENL